MKLFEYSIIFVPNKDSAEKKAKIISPIKAVLAEDAGQVNILAAREIPEEYLGQLSSIQVAVRPF